MKNIIALLLLFVSVSNAETGPNQGAAIPYEQGEVVFKLNEDSPNQIYIIGMSHRDTLTRVNGSDTVKAHVEVYRISEWLIQNQGLELLLHEGFVWKEPEDEKKDLDKAGNSTRVSLDRKTLEEKLGNDSVYINAEMLLLESQPIESRQVEDRDLHNAVREKISLLEKFGNDTYESLFIKADLDYLQERRTAAMLQRMPEVIAGEYEAGRIKNKKAIFTIGLSNLFRIVKHLKQKRIEINSPAFSPYQDYLSGIKLLEEKYGITIIIPRTLMNDRKLMKLTRLDDIN